MQEDRSSRRGPAQIPLSERFPKKVNRDGPMPAWHPEYGQCWLWTASLGSSGYGQVGMGGRGNRPLGAHVAAWLLASSAPVPDGYMIGHTCDLKICVRNDEDGVYIVNGVEYSRFGHLWLATIDANNRDMYTKGRSISQSDPERLRQSMSKPRSHKYNQGDTNRQAKLNDALVLEILQRYATGETKTAIANDLNVTDTLIGLVVRRIRWSHVQWPQD